MRPRRLIRSRLPIAAGLVALVILTATTPSATAAATSPTPARQQPVGRQDATVEGVVVHADGSPAEGVSVSVVGYDNAGFAGIVTTLFTLGLACFAERIVCLGDSTEGGAMTTGADGRYHGSLPDSYVAGQETDTDWVVTAGLPATGDQAVGPRSTFEFEVNILVQAAPPLPVWQATPSISVDGWQATASVDGDPPSGTGRTTVTVGGISTSGTTGSVDLRFLELDEAAADETLLAYATAFADVRVPHANGRTIYHQAVSTGAVALPTLDLVPPSRGAPCTMVVADGSPAPEAGDGCPATDGSGSYVPAGVTSLTVALPSPVDVSAVFVAGGRDGTVVEVSGDGSSWSSLVADPLASPSSFPTDRVLVASPAGPTSGRFVRVSRAEGLDGVTEVSVWSGPTARSTPPPEAGSTPAGPETQGGQAVGSTPPETTTGSGNRTGTLVVALVVLCLVGAAAGAVGWARSRRPA